MHPRGKGSSTSDTVQRASNPTKKISDETKNSSADAGPCSGWHHPSTGAVEP